MKNHKLMKIVNKPDLYRISNSLLPLSVNATGKRPLVVAKSLGQCLVPRNFSGLALLAGLANRTRTFVLSLALEDPAAGPTSDRGPRINTSGSPTVATARNGGLAFFSFSSFFFLFFFFFNLLK